MRMKRFLAIAFTALMAVTTLLALAISTLFLAACGYAPGPTILV